MLNTKNRTHQHKPYCAQRDNLIKIRDFKSLYQQVDNNLCIYVNMITLGVDVSTHIIRDVLAILIVLQWLAVLRFRHVCHNITVASGSSLFVCCNITVASDSSLFVCCNITVARQKIIHSLNVRTNRSQCSASVTVIRLRKELGYIMCVTIDGESNAVADSSDRYPSTFQKLLLHSYFFFFF